MYRSICSYVALTTICSYLQTQLFLGVATHFPNYTWLLTILGDNTQVNRS